MLNHLTDREIVYLWHIWTTRNNHPVIIVTNDAVDDFYAWLRTFKQLQGEVTWSEPEQRVIDMTRIRMKEKT